MGTHGIGVYGINSKFASGNLVFYEKAVGRSATGDVLTIGTTAVTVGGTAQAVDFKWYATGDLSFILSASDSSMTLVGLNVAIDGDIVIGTDDLAVEQGYYLYLDGLSGGEYVRSASADTLIVNATTSLYLGIGGTAETVLTTSAFSPFASGGNALGTTSLMWSNLFLASAGVINFAAGNATITHSTGALAVNVPTTFDSTLAITGQLNANATTASNGVTAGAFVCDGGVGIAKELYVGLTSNLAGAITASSTLGIAGLITSTSITGFRSNPTFVPDANRTNYAFAVGQGHTSTNELSVTMAADAAQNFDPFQMNVNIIGVNPSVTSTTNLMYAKLTHDFAHMADLRLKCTDFTVEVGKNVLDAYVYQGEIVFTAGVTVGNQACPMGLVLDAGVSAVTCSEWRGLNITLRGAGTPATAQAILIDGAADITLREAIWICGGGITAAIRLARVDNYANAPINLVALPPAGYTPVSSHTGIANGGTVVKIACLVGDTPYYILASTAPA